MKPYINRLLSENRLAELRRILSGVYPEYDTVLIIGRVNQYYYTGTMQDGILVLRKDGSMFFFVRKSYERAKIESPFEPIIRISTYRDILAFLPEDLGKVCVETEAVPVAMLDRIRKYFRMDGILPLDRVIATQRAVKGSEELGMIHESGRRHADIMEHTVPAILREGMSETDFAAELYAEMIKKGHHGVSRFSMFQMEIIIGQFGFGETSLYPTNFDGPGGMKGMSPVVPILGDRERILKKGDMVFVDVGFGYMGYHSDKTQVYSFGAEPSDLAVRTHRACIDVMNQVVSGIRPGAIPADIYISSTANLPEELSEHFMGYNGEKVKFLGHGVGLFVDELPIIAGGYKEPLRENMVIAIEPKCGIEGVGTVGVEETYVVTKNGAECLTGGPKDIVTVWA
ncbi:MAG: aminopeptidase P family protein [Clostridiaceae bacterium]|nr:aminopeptidase P family protein [Clostridiaceae bacterium]